MTETMATGRQITIRRSCHIQRLQSNWLRSPRNLMVSIGGRYAYALIFGMTLAFMGVFHRYHDITLFMSLIDIPVSLGNFFQRIASIDHRFDLARLNQLFEE